MTVRRREVISGAIAAGFGMAARAASVPAASEMKLAGELTQPADIIELWPGEAPGMPAQPPVERVVQRSTGTEPSDRYAEGIVRPSLALIPPREPNGAAILIIPGGGYARVVFDKEGFEPGRWFAARGFTSFVLTYRLPGDGWAAGPDVALSDAQRAMRLIRYLADEFELDPKRIAAMGFSAGGHVCAGLATRFTSPLYDHVDVADEFSARPFVAAPIYPVISMSQPLAHAGSRELLIGKHAGNELEQAHSPQLNVHPDTPPCFLLHAEDDASVNVENTLLFRKALRARGIPVETHLFAQGGHGFGMRQADVQPIGDWPKLFLSWSQSMGLV